MFVIQNTPTKALFNGYQFHGGKMTPRWTSNASPRDSCTIYRTLDDAREVVHGLHVKTGGYFTILRLTLTVVADD